MAEKLGEKLITAVVVFVIHFDIVYLLFYLSQVTWQKTVVSSMQMDAFEPYVFLLKPFKYKETYLGEIPKLFNYHQNLKHSPSLKWSFDACL